MSYICIPYSLARQDLLSFKEIHCTLFMQLKSAMCALVSHDAETAPTVESLYNNIVRDDTDIYTKANTNAKRYEQALRAYEEFKREHIEILKQGEMIQASKRPRKFLWILFKTDPKVAFERHCERYKEVYQQLNKLLRMVKKYSAYSPERKNDTINRAKRRQEPYYRYSAEHQLKLWHEKHYKKRSDLASDLYSLHSKIPGAGQFSYLIKDLRVETNGSVCKISGLKDSIYSPKGFTAFNEILINQTITISR